MEFETKGVQLLAGGGGPWGKQIRFIWGDVQIGKLNFQNIFFDI